MHIAELNKLPAARLKGYARKIGVATDRDERWEVSSTNRDWMLEQIIAAHETMGDPVQGVALAAAAPVEAGRVADGEERVHLVIHPQENESDYVFIGVNGDSLLIQREAEVSIPQRFFEALRLAVATQIEYDERTGEERRRREVKRYHFTVLAA